MGSPTYSLTFKHSNSCWYCPTRKCSNVCNDFEEGYYNRTTVEFTQQISSHPGLADPMSGLSWVSDLDPIEMCVLRSCTSDSSPANWNLYRRRAKSSRHLSKVCTMRLPSALMESIRYWGLIFPALVELPPYWKWTTPLFLLTFLKLVLLIRITIN